MGMNLNMGGIGGLGIGGSTAALEPNRGLGSSVSMNSGALSQNPTDTFGGGAIPTMGMGLGVGGLGMPQQNANTNAASNPMANFASSLQIDNPNLDVKLNQTIGNWMTWCQTCKHGGHAQHLSEWFLTNTVCPVSHCKCECSSL
jgi:hypothetical protein